MPIDWIAALFTIVGKWTIGNKHKTGYLILIIAAFLWLIVGIVSNLKGIIALNFVVIFIEFRNYLRWKRQDELKECDIH